MRQLRAQPFLPKLASGIRCFFAWMFLVTRNGESKMIKRYALLLGLLSAFALSACNTMKGAGQDIQSGGEKLEDKAEEVQSK